MATKKRIISGGGTRASVASEALPVSQRHNDPNAEPVNWSEYTINGKPIPEALQLPETLALTDQRLEGRVGTIQEREVADIVNRRRVTKDQDDKRVDAFRDGRQTGNLLLGKDPLQVMAERHTPKGHRHLWIGPKKAAEAGLIRGVVEYKPVMIDDPENPGQRKRVTMNGMFLASVPVHIAEEADAYYASISEDKLKATVEKVREQSDEVLHAGGIVDVARRKRMVDDLVGLQDDNSEAADAELEREGLLDHEYAATE